MRLEGMARQYSVLQQLLSESGHEPWERNTTFLHPLTHTRSGSVRTSSLSSFLRANVPHSTFTLWRNFYSLLIWPSSFCSFLSAPHQCHPAPPHPRHLFCATHVQRSVKWPRGLGAAVRKICHHQKHMEVANPAYQSGVAKKVLL